MAKLGITMIEMYCNMIRNDFEPLVSMLRRRTDGVRDKIESQVKKELGVYDLYAEKAGYVFSIEKDSETFSGLEEKFRKCMGKLEM